MATALKRLKNIATDAVSIPTTQELYDRKVAELTDAKRKLDELVARQIKIESIQQRRKGDTDAVLAEKRATKEKIARLGHEGGLLKQQLIDARPKPPLTPQQQLWADALAVHPTPGKWQAATGTEIDAARAEVDALAKQCREARASASPGAEARLIPSLTDTKVRLVALQGPPCPPFSRWLSKDALTAALKTRGVL